ncbi:nuclear transport factor 2 family protein [Streptomyces sp. NPDC048639]|uniref:nuclear transport factor 2 family protein n=1 Tax=Streptomyces sp. NPDC048639 TaxID=3365581 RepID=UPI003715A960
MSAVNEPDPTAAVTDLVRRYQAAWATRDVDAIMDLHAPGTTFCIHNGTPRSEGADEVRKTFEGLLAMAPDLAFHEVRLFAAASSFTFEYRMTATLPGSKEQASLDGVDVVTVADGRVEHKDTYLDSASLEAVLTQAAQAAA